MRFAFNLPNFGEFSDVRVLAEVAAAAEAGGWDGCFIWDHVSPVFAPEMEGLPVADVTVALTAIALATERIQFGPMIAPLPRRRIQKFAREMATLDRVSGGRVVCGVGLGYPPGAEFEAFGEDGSEVTRAERLDESLAVLTALWSGERVDFDGKHLRVHTSPLLPTPVQQPRIPILVAATWPGRAGPLRRAARFDGVVPISADTPATFINDEDITAIRAAIGREDAFDVAVDGGPDADPAAFAAAGVTWWLQGEFSREIALQSAKEGPPRPSAPYGNVRRAQAGQ